MTSYEIIITPNATEDLVELRDYIADVLRVPDIALSYIRTIREEISKLSIMPERIKPLEDEYLCSLGVRKIKAKNFYIYYRIDENAEKVFILNIIYAKRDQLRQLNKMKNE